MSEQADSERGSGRTPLRVIETSLYVDDLIEAERFYSEVLGLEAFARAKGRHLFFRVARGVLLLFNAEKTAIKAGEVPSHGASGPGHVAFAASRREIERWIGRLEGAGVEIEADVEWPAGGRSIYFRDPAGNSLELTTPETWGLGPPL